MIKVYVAGAMSDPKPIKFLGNLNKGIRASVELLLLGYAPFCPFIDFQYFLNLQEEEEIDEETIKDYSLEWLAVSEAMLVLDGWEDSEGVASEIELAQELDIPIFYSIDELEGWFNG